MTKVLPFPLPFLNMGPALKIIASSTLYSHLFLYFLMVFFQASPAALLFPFTFMKMNQTYFLRPSPPPVIPYLRHLTDSQPNPKFVQCRVVKHTFAVFGETRDAGRKACAECSLTANGKHSTEWHGDRGG